MPARSIWYLKSGPVSMTNLNPSVSTITLLLNRRSIGSDDWHTSQSQPIIGTPLLVPVPRNVTRKD
jgi:hypothetical protein